jgi:hypothetical protein
VPALQTPDGKQAYFGLVAAKANKALWFHVVFSGVGLLGLAGLFFMASKGVPWPVSMGVFGVSALLLVAVDFTKWKEHEYYTVPGSRDGNGEHRCIHCGHRGIHRSTEYKTTTTYARCSKCRETLWVE